MLKSNISLIGMPACGKSTVGVLAAKALNLEFIDTDLLIQRKHGQFLWQLIDSEGIGGFIARESEVIRSLECKDSCIATGGSAVYSGSAMEHLKRISTVVFIDLSCEGIESRIADIRGRGVAIGSGGRCASCSMNAVRCIGSTRM